jgi:hypothetical protein
VSISENISSFVAASRGSSSVTPVSGAAADACSLARTLAFSAGTLDRSQKRLQTVQGREHWGRRLAA